MWKMLDNENSLSLSFCLLDLISMMMMIPPLFLTFVLRRVEMSAQSFLFLTKIQQQEKNFLNSALPIVAS
jgi:hypothetical protein